MIRTLQEKGRHWRKDQSSSVAASNRDHLPSLLGCSLFGANFHSSTLVFLFISGILTGDVHPIHIHLVRFQVLNRQPFDVNTYLQTGKMIFTGMPIAAESNERPAWKDTIKTYPGYLTRVIQKFDLPPGTQTTPGQEFRYVWHCHILEHEDNEMMPPYKIVG